jgi:ABC-type uncharacterized transport system fused permease/ATPase subunit
MVYINVLLNQWNNTFYNALQDKDYTVFVHQLIRFAWLAGLYIIVAVYQLYLNQMLQIRWRRWLTERYLGAWLTDGAYYRMQLVAGETDNPDQRLAEDVRLLIADTLSLARILFLPQKPYLPIGTLRDVVSYPMPAGGVDDATLREALEAVGLPELTGRLDEAGHWALQLSPGEQQRIAFARALVQKPDWLFLDEATSAVDEAT